LKKKIKTHWDLGLWPGAISLVIMVYDVTAEFLGDEKFGGLVSQMKRAAVSIPVNIAEGVGT